MRSPQQSKLSLLVPDEQASRFYSANPMDQLGSLRRQLKDLVGCFQLFKEEILSGVNEWMGRASTILYRSLRERLFLEGELQKSKQIQNTMRTEVIQLKDMINEAMKDYAKELQSKDIEIGILKERLQKCHRSVVQPQSEETEIRIDQSQAKSQDEALQIIQQESEPATYSSTTSLREFREDQDKENFFILPEETSPQPENKQQAKEYKAKEQINGKSDHKRTKSFIDNFRKTIEESFQSKQNQDRSFKLKPFIQIHQNALITQQKYAQQSSHPLRDIVNNQNYQRSFTNCLKDKTSWPLPIPNNSQALRSLAKQLSPDSSNSQFGQIIENQPTIESNPVKKFETPSCLFIKKQGRKLLQHEAKQMFLKNSRPSSESRPIQKEGRHHLRTEASPERIRPSPLTQLAHPAINNYFSHKPTQSSHKIERKWTCQRSHSQEDKKSIKTSASKQKIKVTSRIIEEMHPRKSNLAVNSKAVVHLGGKSLFRKFLLQLKHALRGYFISLPSSADQLKYEGTLRAKTRCGRGRLFYRNGIVYEGQFKDNIRQGRGSLWVNGISIFQGEWAEDQLSGEGYIKSMRMLGLSCPILLQEASFCGNLLNNRLEGIGTIFLNPKEKIVTKFSNGCPIGELTYYNLHEIEFGVWPSD